MRMKKALAVLLSVLMLVGTAFVPCMAEGSNPFADVPEDIWYFGGVQYAHEHGLMNGTGDSLFSPDVSTTRGMVVTILYRLDGAQPESGTAFPDVASGLWYSDAIGWASAKSIVNGYDSGNFGPNDDITREQMAAILYRYSQYRNYDLSADSRLSEFNDAAQISGYAVDNMAWANSKGLINGLPGNILAPRDKTTRAQAAVILHRFCELFDALKKEVKPSFNLAEVPEYSGKAVVEINRNVPYFEDSDLSAVSQIKLSELDSLGRCQVAFGVLGPDTVATGERGSIGMIKPTGWHTVRYDDLIEDSYLFNRCHLLMWKASSILDDNRNLITGTRYLNIEGMLPYEMELLDTIESNGFHVLYRVTPVFEGDNLVASGVLMEAKSVEDFGKDLQFCVYAYNVQPGVGIDYATGDSWRLESLPEDNTPAEVKDYVLNVNSKKFHNPDCSSVEKMKPQNRKDVKATRDDLIAQGYSPCGICKP